MPRPSRRTDSILAFAASVVALIVYIPTVSSTVTFTDNGELAAVAATFGVAHPTGYPLFTILARLASLVPVADIVIFRLNLFAALVTAAAVGLFYMVAREVQESSVFPGRKGSKNPEQTRLIRIASALTAALVFGFSSTVWSQATSLEVYGLHTVLVLTTTLLFIRGVSEQSGDSSTTSPNLLAFAFVLGLSFANHMTTVLLAPGFLYLYFTVLGLNAASVRRLLRLAPFFLLALSLYLILPVRSGAQPPLDWGNTGSLEKLFWHISGKQYRVWMFEGWSVAKKQLSHFAGNFSNEVNLFAWPFLVLGFLRWREERRKITFLFLLFASCVASSMNYDIHDIDSYFLLAYLATAVVFAAGFERVASIVRDRLGSRLVPAIEFVAIVLVTLQVAHNRSGVSAREERLVDGFVSECLTKLPANAMVISGLWDTFVSPMYYMQMVEGRRGDVTVVDKSLMQDRVWYFRQLQRNHPEVAAGSAAEIAAFLSELEKFEHGEPFQLPVIQARWSALLSSLVSENAPHRPVFVDWRIQREFDTRFRRTPFGLFVRLSIDSSAVPDEAWDVKFRPSVRPTDFSNDLKQYLAESYVENVQRLRQGGRDSLAVGYLESLRSLEPKYASMLEKSYPQGTIPLQKPR